MRSRIVSKGSSLVAGVLVATGVAIAVLPDKATAREDDLKLLATFLQDELATANLDDATRTEVRALLVRGLELVRKQKGPASLPPDAECMDFVQPIYEKLWQPSTAVTTSAKFCNEPIDTDLLIFAHGIHAKQWQSDTALNEAAKLARRQDLAGKTKLIDFAYKRYSKHWQAATALEAAVKLAAGTGREALPCIERSYETFSKQYETDSAMKQAFSTCGTR